MDKKEISEEEKFEFEKYYFIESRKKGLYFSIGCFVFFIFFIFLSYIGFFNIEMRYLSFAAVLISLFFIPFNYYRVYKQEFTNSDKEIMYKYMYIFVFVVWSMAGTIMVKGYSGFMIYFFTLIASSFFITLDIKKTIYFYGLSTFLFISLILVFASDFEGKRGLLSGGVLINIFSFYITRSMYNYKFENYVIRKRLEEKNKIMHENHQKLTEDFEKIADIDKKLKANIQKVMNFLNSTDQGFLSFGEKFIIDGEVSDKCNDIFGRDIIGKNIFEILPLAEGEEIVKQIFQEIIKNPNKRNQKLLIPLLPEKLKIRDKIVKIEYKLFMNYGKTKIMLIMTDITEVIQLENRIHKEKEILEMVLKVMKYRNEFNELLKEYKKFCTEKFYGIFEKENFDNIVYMILEELHTLKGNFSQLGLKETAKKIHKLEDAVIEYYETKYRPGIIWVNYDEVAKYPDIEIRHLKEYFEDIISDDDILEIKAGKLKEIESILKNGESSEKIDKVISKINELRYQNFKTVLTIYSKYVFELSEQRKKKLKEFIVEGDEIFVEVDKYKKFGKSLVHIFRNIVDHAFYEDEEMVNRKNIIKIVLKKQEKSIFISIEDNGKGIDCHEIRMKLVEMGKYTEDEVESIEEEEIINKIFEEGFSTAKSVTEISGRGVGLSYVKKIIESMSGTIKVKTKLEEGTIFEILIPILE